jgi:hypothetical protein
MLHPQYLELQDIAMTLDDPVVAKAVCIGQIAWDVAKNF